MKAEEPFRPDTPRSNFEWNKALCRRTSCRGLLPAKAGKANRNVTVENDVLRLEFVRQADGFAYAKILARQSTGWAQVAVWRPLFRVVNDTASGERGWEI